MVHNKYDEPLHVKDWKMAFRIAKCGQHLVFQSMYDKNFYLSSLQSGTVRSRLRSERVTRFTIETDEAKYPITRRKWSLQ